MSQPRIGGSFAPPLSDSLLEKYRGMVDSLILRDPESRVADAMQKLLHCCGIWWELPDSKGAGKPHPIGAMKDGNGKSMSAMLVDLDEEHKETLWEHIPWEEELVGMDKAFEALDTDTQRDLRNAAYHLLWHVRELNLDREPLTNDKL